MATHSPSLPLSTKITLGFIAGCIAVPTFHQATIALLGALGMLKPNLYSMSPLAPFGVPQIVSQSFWGGLWGIVFVWLFAIRPKAVLFYVTGFLFGAIALPLVSWFIVAPIKGLPLAAGWVPARMLNGILINGGWGLGLAVFAAIGVRLLGQSRARPLAV